MNAERWAAVAGVGVALLFLLWRILDELGREVLEVRDQSIADRETAFRRWTAWDG